MIWLSLALNYTGIALIAATMEAHHRRMPASLVRLRPLGLRAAGIGAHLAAFAVPFLRHEDATGAFLIWIIGWMACAFTFSCVLSLHARGWFWPIIVLMLALIVT